MNHNVRWIVRVSALFLLAAACIVRPDMAHASQKSPMTILKSASDELFRIIDVQHNRSGGYSEAQRKQLALLANRIFDFRKMARLSLGRHARKFGRADFDRFAALFARMLENAYIEKLENYSGEKIFFDRERMLSPKKAVVETRIIHNGKEIPVHYRFYRSSSGWKGYDIVIEGISLIKNYRTQFQEILHSGKPADLIGQLERKLSGGHAR